VAVRNGTHKLVVEGLVQTRERSVVTATGSDVVDYASYLPIYHNESYVFFQQKYVSLFITLDNVAYVVPANSPGMCTLHKVIGP